MTLAPSRDDWDHHWATCAAAVERNPAQRMRRRLIRVLLGVAGSPIRIVDIGSGQGDLIRDLRRWYPRAELCGIDHSQAGLDAAARKVADAVYVRADLLEHQTPPAGLRGWASHAVCSEVLEHVDDPGAVLRNARAYLAPGCRLVVTVPGGPMSAFDREIGHRRHFTRDSLRRLLAENGLEVERTAGYGFPFFNLYRLVVILRGRRLMGDVASDSGDAASRPAELAMTAFRGLFTLNLPWGLGGWQIVGVARVGDR